MKTLNKNVLCVMNSVIVTVVVVTTVHILYPGNPDKGATFCEGLSVVIL